MKYLYVPALLLAIVATPAFAHIAANPDQAEPGKYFQTSFRIFHGCKDSNTVAVTVKIPEGIVTTRAQYKPEWKVMLKKRKLDAPVSVGHGKTTDEVVEEVTWEGGPLPANQYDDFGVVMKMPDTPGKTLWFPVIQKCESGEIRWVEIPPKGREWHEMKSPAPFVKLQRKSTR